MMGGRWRTSTREVFYVLTLAVLRPCYFLIFLHFLFFRLLVLCSRILDEFEVVR